MFLCRRIISRNVGEIRELKEQPPRFFAVLNCDLQLPLDFFNLGTFQPPGPGQSHKGFCDFLGGDGIPGGFAELKRLVNSSLLLEKPDVRQTCGRRFFDGLLINRLGFGGEIPRFPRPADAVQFVRQIGIDRRHRNQVRSEIFVLAGLGVDLALEKRHGFFDMIRCHQGPGLKIERPQRMGLLQDEFFQIELPQIGELPVRKQGPQTKDEILDIVRLGPKEAADQRAGVHPTIDRHVEFQKFRTARPAPIGSADPAFAG